MNDNTYDNIRLRVGDLIRKYDCKTIMLGWQGSNDWIYSYKMRYLYDCLNFYNEYWLM